MVLSYYVVGLLVLLLVGLVIASLRTVNQYQRGLIERFGKYNRYAKIGLNFVIPFIERVRIVNITEMMVDAGSQEIITKDKLNARVDAQVYFKVKDDEESVKNSQYKVYDYYVQIVQLARTTLRNIIGTMTLNEANSDRNNINKALLDTLSIETKNWGIDIVRTELKEINPPEDVQETMNKVVKAENEKQAAVDFATAEETKADGIKRARIKEAEGLKQSEILKAEGQAKAFDMINKSFIDNAQILKKLEVTQASLENNAKIILTDKGINPNIILGEIPISQPTQSPIKKGGK